MKTLCRVLAVLFAVALIALPIMVLASCSPIPKSAEPSAAQTRERIIAIARVFGDAYVRLRAAPLLQREAPHLLPIVDRDGDKEITLAEIEALSVDAFSDPIVATIVIVAVEEAVRRR